MIILNEVILIHATGGDGLYEEIKSLLQSKKIRVREIRDISTIELMFGSLRINYMQHEAYQMDQAAGLSSNEFSALWYMASNSGRVFTKGQIYEYVYQEEPMGGIDNLISYILDTHNEVGILTSSFSYSSFCEVNNSPIRKE